MYAELDLKLKAPIERIVLLGHIQSIVGGNSIALDEALAGTALENIPAIRQSALLAEQIVDTATAIYFMEGNDAIKIHVIVRSLTKARQQCERITRQLSARLGTVARVEATILVTEKGTGEDVAIGERVTLWRRFREAFAEKFLTKLLPAATTFALAAMFIQGATIVVSSAIGVAAACVGAFFEVWMAIRSSSEWKWKDVT